MSSRRKNCSASKSEVLASDSIFGRPPILPGEDASAYEALLARVSADVKPADIIEKIWVRDTVDLTWEIFRLRIIKATLAEFLAQQLTPFVPETPEYATARKTGAITGEVVRQLSQEFAERWIAKEPDAVAWINELETNGRISMHAVMTSSFSRELLRIERVDRLIMAAEGRRNAVLREIGRRREIAFARSLRGAIQKAEDAEFEVIEQQAIPPTNNDNQNAA